MAFLLSVDKNGKPKKRPIFSTVEVDRETIYHETCAKLKKEPATYSLALITGEESNLSVVDIDLKDDKGIENGMAVWEATAAKHSHEGLGDAVCAKSQSGGLHYYFSYTPELAHGQKHCFKSESGQWSGIDIRNNSNGGFIVCHPSPNYEWIRSPFDSPLTPCPQWIIDWHKNSVAKQVKEEKAPTAKKESKSKNKKMALNELTWLVKRIRPDVADDYDSWLRVIMALHKTSHDGGYPSGGLRLAHEFSKRSSKYDPDELDSKWESFSTADLRIGSNALVEFTDNSYDVVKQKFESTCFKVLHPLQYCVEMPDYDDLWTYGRDPFIHLYENLFYTVATEEGPKKVKFVLNWLQDEEIRQYEEVVFDPPPYKAKPKCYNIYRGLEAEKLDAVAESDIKSLISPILTHLKIMVNHDDAGFDYVVKWLAHRIQFPGSRPKVALAFKSLQGAGKGIFWEWFGESIIGMKYYFSTSGMRDLTGNFNEGLKHRILIFLDETRTRDAFRESDELKRLIDAPTLKVNEKYSKVATLRNCAGWVFASNNSIPVCVENGDRRYFVAECSAEKKGDSNYFSNLAKAMKDPTVQRAFYEYLMDLDLSEFELERDRPTTDLYNDLKEAAAPADVAFVQYLIDTGMLEEEPKVVSGSKLQGYFNDFKEHFNFPKEVLSGNRFGLAMKKWFVKSMPKNKATYYLDKAEAIKRLLAAGYTQFQPEQED